MDKPLTIWYCDVCQERIKDVKEGYIIWKTTEQLKTYDFKIIHKAKCDRTDYPASSALEDFLGERGLAYLLALLSLGPIKKLVGEGSHCSALDMDEFVDFVRRVQTPYYEEARRLFKNVDFLNSHFDDDEASTYFPDTLKEIIEKYSVTR